MRQREAQKQEPTTEEIAAPAVGYVLRQVEREKMAARFEGYCQGAIEYARLTGGTVPDTATLGAMFSMHQERTQNGNDAQLYSQGCTDDL